MSKPNVPHQHRRLVWGLLAAVIAMFGFGFALVPIYNHLCQAWGINGKPKLIAAAYDPKTATIVKDRTVLVEFISTQNPALPWAFYPETKKVRLHPGEQVKLSFYAENHADKTMTVQAIPSITPGIAAKYVKKMECFCFTQQTFKPHEARHMPLVFHLDAAIPPSVHTLTLSYTLFDVSDRVKVPQ